MQASRCTASYGRAFIKLREHVAKEKFDVMRRTMEATMIETTINEARAEGSNSHLQKLPNDVLNNVYGYLLGKEFENDENANISKQISLEWRHHGLIKEASTAKKVGDKYLPFGVDFSDLSLFEPGNKITIPLTLPDFDVFYPNISVLKKHVVKSSGWDLKRVVCTPAEKKLHKEDRPFINAIYKVPGTVKKKSRKNASTANTNVSTSAAYASASATAAVASASAPNAKKRAAPATKAPKKPAYKANPAATAALQAALASAEDGDGVVDPECLKKAFSFGFSKAFIDAKVDEQEALNVKPAAKN